MSKFKKKGSRVTPAISTASLPDIVFILLFFFMVTTTMREVTLMVDNRKPYATEIEKLERKSLVSYIYVGAPKAMFRGQFGSEPRMQLNDSYAKLNEIGQWAIAEREAINEAERALLTVSIKADKEVKMGLVTDIKQELRKAQMLKINYSTRKGEIFSDR